jgi:large subunit ribosomal protein L23
MEVNSLSNKVEIKRAFERLYGVKVEGVNIVKTREKVRNTRKGVAIKKKPATKALIALEKGQRVADLMKLKIKD